MTVVTLDVLSSVSEQAVKRAKKSAIFASWTLWDCSIDQRDFGNSTLLATFRVGTPSLE